MEEDDGWEKNEDKGPVISGREVVDNGWEKMVLDYM